MGSRSRCLYAIHILKNEPPLGAHQGVRRKIFKVSRFQVATLKPTEELLAGHLAVGHLGLEAELLGEFGETGPGIVLLQTAATAAALIGRTIGALVGGSPESYELVQTIAHAGEGAGNTLYQTHRVTGIVAFLGVPADDGQGELLDTVYDIAESTTQLAGCSILRRGGRLNVGIRRADHSEKKC